MGRTPMTWSGTLLATLACLALLTGCVGKDDAPSSASGPPAAECGRLTGHPDPARQTRAMWISTVGNGDWPDRSGLPAAKQQAQYRHLLDVARKLNFNTVYVQIRPTADAFYPSPYEPWSLYLTGHQGRDPGYDPLRFLVEEAHARGLEFHAWFNPYRVSTQTDPGTWPPAARPAGHPDWVRATAARSGTTRACPRCGPSSQVVLDVVRKYDIDGVHFDDYFYPYPLPPARPSPTRRRSSATARASTTSATGAAHNVDTLIEGLPRGSTRPNLGELRHQPLRRVAQPRPATRRVRHHRAAELRRHLRRQPQLDPARLDRLRRAAAVLADRLQGRRLPHPRPLVGQAGRRHPRAARHRAGRLPGRERTRLEGRR